MGVINTPVLIPSAFPTSVHPTPQPQWWHHGGKEKEQGQILPPYPARQRDPKELQPPPGAGCHAGGRVAPVLRWQCHPLPWVLFELQDICAFLVMLEHTEGGEDVVLCCKV